MPFTYVQSYIVLYSILNPVQEMRLTQTSIPTRLPETASEETANLQAVNKSLGLPCTSGTTLQQNLNEEGALPSASRRVRDENTGDAQGGRGVLSCPKGRSTLELKLHLAFRHAEVPVSGERGDRTNTGLFAIARDTTNFIKVTHTA